MDEEDQKICPNCKREIPAVNFTIHTVHCARNIRMCPVCKEPVPQVDLQLHHDKLHKLLPCKQCGESVCGTDLEDHIRDSCGNTIKSCRFCELELPRSSLPAHEAYCGARTEQCADCREWVMIKYRQLHVDSNHGFLRLDDDPAPPKPKKDPPKSTNTKATNIPTPTHQASTSNGIVPPLKTTNEDRPKTTIKYFNTDGPTTSAGSSSDDSVQVNRSGGASNIHNVPNGTNVQKAPLKRNNDQPQVNRYSWLASSNKVIKDLPGRGALKKRPAPKPPTYDPKRELAYYSALNRHQQEEKKRQEQTAYNLAMGLPPVLSPAAKLDKLRKMDALHNRETEPVDYRERLRGRVWMDHVNVPTGNVLGSQDDQILPSDSRGFTTNPEAASSTHNPEAASSTHNPEETHDFRNLKPMSPEEFMDRFKKLQLKKEREGESERSRERRERREGPLWITRGINVDRAAERDRFNDIKSSLRELRRGLNEVIAPYNAANASVASIPNSQDGMRRSPGPVSPPPGDADDEVCLPCEFCGAPVPAHDLVQHQTGCRPDLTQFRPRSPPRAPPSPPPAPPRARPPPADPVIPCEFCAQSLPVYLISEHQERCERESNPLLYPD